MWVHSWLWTREIWFWQGHLRVWVLWRWVTTCKAPYRTLERKYQDSISRSYDILRNLIGNGKNEASPKDSTPEYQGLYSELLCPWWCFLLSEDRTGTHNSKKLIAQKTVAFGLFLIWLDVSWLVAHFWDDAHSLCGGYSWQAIDHRKQRYTHWEPAECQSLAT